MRPTWEMRPLHLAGYGIAVGGAALLLVSAILSLPPGWVNLYPLLVVVGVGICWHVPTRPTTSLLLLALAGLAYLGPHATHVSQLPNAAETRRLSLLVLITLWIASTARAWAVARRRAGVAAVLEAGLLAHMADAALLLDRAGAVVSANPLACRLLGLPETEIVGRPMASLLARHAEGPELVRDGLPEVGRPASAAAAAQPVWTGHAHPVPVDVSLSPLAIKGTRLGTIAALRPRSEQDAGRRLEENEPYYRELLENAPDCMWVTDLYGYLVLANAQTANLFGYADPQDMLGLSALELLAPEDRQRAVRDKWRTIRDGSVAQAAYLARRRDATTFTLECNLSLVSHVQGPTAVLVLAREAPPIQDEEASSAYTSVAWQHVTAAAVGVFGQSASVAEAIPRLLETVCNMAGWDAGLYWAYHSDEGVLRCNRVWHRTSVYIPAFQMMCRQLSLVPGMDVPGRALDNRAAIWTEDLVLDPGSPRALMAAREEVHAGLCLPILIRGEVCGVLEFLCQEPRSEDGDLVQQMSAVASLCARFIDLKDAERSLEYRASHDPLTDLPNRTLLEKRLGHALGAAREYGKKVAILGIDLDGFKKINDVYGHQRGDALLKEVASRLTGALRESDTVARMGGDEFTVLLPRTDESAAATVAAKIHVALRQPFAVDGHRFEIGGSIGIAVYPDHGHNLDSLIHCADLAMYLAKRTGGGYVVYGRDVKEPSRGLLGLAAR